MNEMVKKHWVSHILYQARTVLVAPVILNSGSGFTDDFLFFKGV